MTKLYYPSNVERYRSIANKYSKHYGVPVDVIMSTIKKESAGNPDAWNGSNNENSRGLMQISEKTATTHKAVDVSFMALDTLYDPDTNIDKGTSLLRWIYDYLTPYYSKTMSEKLKWKLASSSYNQGHGYYKWALQSTDEKNERFTWDNILNNVLNPTRTTRTPWRSSAQTYGPSIVDPIADIYLKKLSNPSSFFASPVTGSELSSKHAGSSMKQNIAKGSIIAIFGGGAIFIANFIRKDKKLMKKMGL